MNFVDWYKENHKINRYNGTLKALLERFYKENPGEGCQTLDLSMRYIGELARDYEITIQPVPLFGISSILQAHLTIIPRERR